MHGDGDAWVHCAAGHRHWGRYGAAGLYLTDGTRAVLQHRAPWTHEGDTWGLPGGARDSAESAVLAALREAHEEAALDADLIEPIGLSIADHDGWSYTTVIARPLGELHPHAANAESVEIRWWDLAEIDTLPLHPGLRASRATLGAGLPRLVLVVPPEARSDSARLHTVGVASAALPAGLLDTRLDILFPRITSDPADVGPEEVALLVESAAPAGWLPAQLARGRS